MYHTNSWGFFNFINNKLIFPQAWGKWHKWHLQEEPLSCHDNGTQRFGANMVSDEPHSRQETCALWWLNGRGALGTTSLWKEDGYFTVSRSHSYLLIRFAQSWWNCLYACDAREKKPLVSRVSRWLRRLLKTTKKKQQTNKNTTGHSSPSETPLVFSWAVSPKLGIFKETVHDTKLKK